MSSSATNQRVDVKRLQNMNKFTPTTEIDKGVRDGSNYIAGSRQRSGPEANDDKQRSDSAYVHKPQHMPSQDARRFNSVVQIRTHQHELSSNNVSSRQNQVVHNHKQTTSECCCPFQYLEH